MLSWRLLIGIPIIGFLLGISYLDMYLSDMYLAGHAVFWGLTRIPRGIILFPVFLFVVALLCDEVLDLLEAGGIKPRRTTVYLGNFGILLVCWCSSIWQQWKLDQFETGISTAGWEWASTPSNDWDWVTAASTWTFLACALGLIFAFVGEIVRFKPETKPGKATTDLAGAIFAVAYIGMLSTFIIQLRVIYGLAALFSLVVVTKMGDVGAYTVGRLIGRTKMSPDLSPGKTIEGLIGGLAFGCFGSWLWFKIVIPVVANKTWLLADDMRRTTTAGWLIFGLFVAGSGVLGDLAESLIKRDVQRKDSSRWMPGFGGILDIFDSLLIAAPVAYACWVLKLVCPGHH